MEEKTTLVAVWKNGVKKIIPDLDKLFPFRNYVVRGKLR